jgi:thiol-disulfide isomerase/thioredoxin
MLLESVLRVEIFLLLGAALFASGCDKQSAQQPQAKQETAAETSLPDEPENVGTLDISHKGEAMPIVAFEAPNGDPVTLGDFRGRPLLVNLWATWCGPCVKEMPTLDAVASRESERLQVMVISQDSQGHAAVDPWWGKQNFKLLQPYLDKKSDLGFAYSTGMVPTTVLYDKDGKEVWRVIGGMNWDGPRANTLLAETLGG